MTFKKGVSANPGGRPKGVRQRAKDALRKHGTHPLDFLASVVASKKEKTRDRVVAAQELLNRLYGKAPAFIENKVDTQDNEITIRIVESDNTSQVLIETEKKEADKVIDVTPAETDRTRPN